MIPFLQPGDALRPTAIALGSFDGLHRGHRRVISAVAHPAGSSAPEVPTVVSFWPHPREVLHGETRLRLDLPSEKLGLLEPLGIRQLVLIPFDRTLAARRPEEFVREVLADQLQARRIAVGENFRFGAGRVGDASDLARIGRDCGIEVNVLPMLWEGGERVSSSRIRRALACGRIEEANHLLDRPYRFSGRVVRGRGLGSGLGWPTANLRVDHRKFLPMQGVYAVWAWQRGPGEPFPPEPAESAMAAVMNLGPQPTVDPQAPSAVEVHLIDRRIELMDRKLTVEPIALLRGQRRFADLQALSAQIADDAREAMLLLRRSAAGSTRPV